MYRYSRSRFKIKRNNRHTAKFYENWIRHNGLTLSDMINYIHRYTGKALERYEVIDFLVREQYTADTLKYMISIQ